MSQKESSSTTAKASRSPGSGKASTTPEADSCLTMLTSLGVTGLDGLSGKMSPACSRRTEDGILEPSSGRWGTWGISSPTGFWTLSGSEHNSFPTQSPSEDVVSSLSDILERGTVPQRYYLSAKACAGILRRAAARSKTLPPVLEKALRAVVEKEETEKGTQTPDAQ